MTGSSQRSSPGCWTSQPRTAYSLRHTYISFRLMEGADIYQISKNCRTGVDMIEKYYASHIKNRLDTAAINVMKARSRKHAEPIMVGADGKLPTPKQKISIGNRHTKTRAAADVATVGSPPVAAAPRRRRNFKAGLRSIEAASNLRSRLAAESAKVIDRSVAGVAEW